MFTEQTYNSFCTDRRTNIQLNVTGAILPIDILSPNFPWTYKYPKFSCTWSININSTSNIRVSFVNFTLPGYQGSVDIGEGRDPLSASTRIITVQEARLVKSVVFRAGTPIWIRANFSKNIYTQNNFSGLLLTIQQQSLSGWSMQRFFFCFVLKF